MNTAHLEHDPRAAYEQKEQFYNSQNENNETLVNDPREENEQKAESISIASSISATPSTTVTATTTATTNTTTTAKANISSVISDAKKSKPGKGKKVCVACKQIIGARAATCPKCKYEYPFKGKPRSKKRSQRTQMLYDADLSYNHDDFPSDYNQEETDKDSPYKPDHSTFMKKKPHFVDIEPKQKKQIDKKMIDSYINESGLLLDCAYEQMSYHGDLHSAAKILNRTLINLTYLATLCDSNDHQQDTCPDLSDFI